MTSPYLNAEVRAGPVDLAVTAAAGETVAVLGPNGAGKTTLLRALAGLVHLETGQVRLDGRDITGLPAHARRVGLVPQGHALLPHLSVRANVAYGLHARGMHRREARRRADDWLDRLDIAAFAHRRPRTLSGGQAQRVALARALVTEPRLLLLDEPLAAVDAAAAVDVRRSLREHLAAYEGACLLVTHDPVEAVTLAGRLLVLDDGRLVQDGTPEDVLRAPRSSWVARMLGMNAYTGTVTGDGVLRLVTGGALVASDLPPTGSQILATVPPDAVALYVQRPDGSPRNTWRGTVGEVSGVGGRVRVQVTGEPDVVAEVTPSAAAGLGLAPGVPVWASVKATEIRITTL
ncbi:MAG: ABC transporter ATP-binding protein [Streptosporangiales bacterium]